MHLTSVKQKRFMFESPGPGFEMHQVRRASATGLTRCCARMHATLPLKYTQTHAGIPTSPCDANVEAAPTLSSVQ